MIPLDSFAVWERFTGTSLSGGGGQQSWILSGVAASSFWFDLMQEKEIKQKYKNICEQMRLTKRDLMLHHQMYENRSVTTGWFLGPRTRGNGSRVTSSVSAGKLNGKLKQSLDEREKPFFQKADRTHLGNWGWCWKGGGAPSKLLCLESREERREHVTSGSVRRRLLDEPVTPVLFQKGSFCLDCWQMSRNKYNINTNDRKYFEWDLFLLLTQQAVCLYDRSLGYYLMDKFYILLK